MYNTFLLILRSRLFNVKDFLVTLFRYWKKPSFARTDLTLLLSYFFKSPYRISRQFEERRGIPEIAPYGETPLAVMQKIVKAATITSQDVVYELGCGRGRTCFWLASWVGCKTVGIEFNPVFVQKAQGVAKMFHTPNVEFRCEDMFTANISEATVLYLYGTCLTDEEVGKLIERCKNMPAGTKVITISYSLLDYADLPQMQMIDTIDVGFPWGTTQAYIQLIK